VEIKIDFVDANSVALRLNAWGRASSCLVNERFRCRLPEILERPHAGRHVELFFEVMTVRAWIPAADVAPWDVAAVALRPIQFD